MYRTLMVADIVADADECADQQNPCEQNCNNTVGSYQCGCRQGYQLVNDTQCEGIIMLLCTVNTRPGIGKLENVTCRL